MSRARAAAVAVTTAAPHAARVPAVAVPVPPAAWTLAAGLLFIIVIAAMAAITIRHHRNRPSRITPGMEEASPL